MNQNTNPLANYSNEAIESAAVAAETWPDDVECINDWYTPSGQQWPAAALAQVELEEYEANEIHPEILCAYNLLKGCNLNTSPELYTYAIDNGKGNQIAEAIRKHKH